MSDTDDTTEKAEAIKLLQKQQEESKTAAKEWFKQQQTEKYFSDTF